MKKDREKDKIKENNKIEYFPGMVEEDDEIDHMLRSGLLKDADEFEREINENPDLADIEAPEDMFESIVAQLKKKGVWEEGDEEEELEETEEKQTKTVELSQEERYALLTEDERDAMRIGQRVKSTTVWRRVMKGIGVAVVAFICIFGVSMTSEANRMYLLGVVNNIVNGRLNIIIGSDGENAEQTLDERDAQVVVKEKIGSSVPVLHYRPDGMVYTGYSIDEDAKVAKILYKYKEKNVYIFISKGQGDIVQTMEFEGEVKKAVKTTILDQEVDIYQMGTYEGLTEYAAHFSYEGSSYVIDGYMEEGEFEELIKWLNF